MFFHKNSDLSFNDWYDNLATTGGFLLIDKDTDWTSFDVVAKLRPALKIKKIGHAGTLDPLATGLLIIACGKATKKIDEFSVLDKSYLANLKLGATTKTFDSEMPEEELKSLEGISDKQVKEAILSFIGGYEQIPPIYSAKKIKGQKLYELARKGKTANPAPVKINISKIENIKISLPFAEFLVECSKGTYIRSLANDIGAKLEVGGYLAGLRRVSIGNFSVDEAFKINEFVKIIHENLNYGK